VFRNISFYHNRLIFARKRFPAISGDNVLYNVRNAPIISLMISISLEVDQVRKAFAAVMILLCMAFPASAKVYRRRFSRHREGKGCGGVGNLDCRYAVPPDLPPRTRRSR
jgi:hypothetical protein